MYKLVVSLALISIVLSADPTPVTPFSLNSSCACPKITVEAVCGSTLVAGGTCGWDATKKECIFTATPATTIPACSSTKDRVTCQTKLVSCTFTAATGTPDVGTCVDAKCSDFTTADTCSVKTFGKLVCQMNTATPPVCEKVTACTAVNVKASCNSFNIGGTQCQANLEQTTCTNLTSCPQLLTEGACNARTSGTLVCQYNSTTNACVAMTTCSGILAANISSCNTYSFPTELCSQTTDKVCTGVKECKDLQITSTTGALLCSSANKCMVKKDACVPLSCGDVPIGECTTYNSNTYSLCYKNKEDCEFCFGSINSVAFAVIAIVLALFF